MAKRVIIPLGLFVLLHRCILLRRLRLYIVGIIPDVVFCVGLKPFVQLENGFRSVTIHSFHGTFIGVNILVIDVDCRVLK